MGTRRLRDMRQRQGLTLAVLDEREDRRRRAEERFGIVSFSRIEDALAWGPAALVISTPPGTKGGYIHLALEHGLHHFTEADIWGYDAAEVERVSREKKLVSAPSTCLRHLPVVRALGAAVRRELGSVLAYQFILSTYMPSWHPNEGLEYYSRHRNTAPAREMVTFELNWLDSIFGSAAEVSGRFEKHGNLPGEMEDTWCLSMRLRNGGVGQLTVTMACPGDFRQGRCFGTNGMITWDIYSGDLSVQTASMPGPRSENFGAVGAVVEAMYGEEIGGFIDAIEGKKAWPHEPAQNQQATATLAAAEQSFITRQWVVVDPNAEPPVAPGRLSRAG